MPSRHHAATPAPRRATTTRRRPRPAPRRRISRLLAWLLAAWLGSAGWAMAQLAPVAPNALPTGGQVRVGTGTLTQTGNLLLIQQNTERLGLDWQSFNIGSGATVEFRQPGASSIALNRVLGNDPSRLYGQLKANGQVFLTNPNGVLFAPSARVDVGGLVASALDLSQQDFAEGRFEFNARGVNGSSASVVNQGQLRASAGGYLALFGQQVSNEGDISVDAGSVVLAAGRAATVSMSANGLLSAVVSAGTAPGQVDNAGRILADGGVVTLSAKSAQGIAASLVNNSGIVRANALVERGGEIWITGDQVATSGTLSAVGAAGGEGGRIAVVADLAQGQARIGGTLDAGTAGGGRGGFVETSGARVQVDRTARVNTTGERGSAGTWLIDPVDFTVAASGGDMTGAALTAGLAGGNVTILSAQGAAGTAGDVNVNDTVAWSANRLTLNAFNNISITAALAGSGTASLALEYGQGAVAAGNTSTYRVTAPVTLPGGSSFSTKLGSNGSTDNFTVITSLAELQAIDTNATTRAGRYALGGDIDLAAQAFNPIGVETSTTASLANSFAGRFDGLGHTLSGLNVTGTAANAGLFASLFNADVRHLVLAGGSVSGGTRAGALAGTADGTTTVRNVSSSAAVTATGSAGGLVGYFQGTGSLGSSSASGTVQGTDNVGGLVGLSNVSISGSSASGSVTNTTANGASGGLVGYMGGGSVSASSASGNVSGGSPSGGLIGQFSSNGTISGSSASGNVTSTAASADVGGLVGIAVGTGALSNSSASGSVTAASNADSVGGLVGQFQMSGGLSNSQSGSADSTVSGGNYTGGLIGWTNISAGFTHDAGNGQIISFRGASVSGGLWVGGLFGSNGTATLTGLSSSASVSATGSAGGLAGYTGGNVSNASASGTVSGRTYVGGLIGQAAGSNTTLTDVSATGNVTNTTVNGEAAGLVGWASGAGILRGSASGTVTGGSYAGGLIGYLDSNGSIRNSTASGHVGGAVNAGGLAGYVSGTGLIADSTANGSVTGSAANSGSVGGLVGAFHMAGGISGSAANGVVIGGYQAGGLVGYSNTTGSITTSTVGGASVSAGTWAGGLVGYAASTGSISGITVNNSVSSLNHAGGLVGYGGGAISASTATGSVTGTGYVGGLVGQMNASVSDSHATGSVTNTTTNGASGGLVGYMTAGNLSASSASGNVTGGAPSGGLIGQFTSNGNISGSTASGNVTSTASSADVGGLIGYAGGTGTLSNSSASGTVTAAANADSVGGLVGEFRMSGGLSNSQSGSTDSTVSGGTYTGGLIGWTSVSAAFTHDAANGQVISFRGASVSGGAWVGGLFGQSTGTAALTGLVASANVSGTGSVGGLAGYTGGNVSNASASGTVSGRAYVGGLVGQAAGTNTTLTDVSATGTVTNTTVNSVAGGLIGYASGAGVLRGQASGTVTGGSYAGGLVGYLDSNGSLRDSVASGNVSGAATAGGLAGYVNGTGLIADSTANGSVTGSTANSGSVGGLVGEFRMSGGISGSAANGVVIGGYQAGGLVGLAVTTGTISGSTVGGASVSAGTWAGGLIGYASGTGSISGITVGNAVSSLNHAGGLVGYGAGAISNSTANGSVTGTGYVGGLAGQMNASVSDSRATGSVTNSTTSGATGGLVGYMTTGSISASSATGNVSGGSPTGGLIGNFTSNGNISGSSATGNVTSTASSADVGGLIGYASGTGALSNSSASGNVTAAANADTVGGLVGQFQMTGGLSNSQAGSGGSSVSGGTYTGGLIGWTNISAPFTHDAGNGQIISFRGASVSGGTWVGGLFGQSTGAAVLSGLSASADVTATGNAGGLAGYTGGNVVNASANGNVVANGNAGGLIANAEGSSSISGSSASGTVTNNYVGGYTGGLVGYASGGSISGSNSSGAVSGGRYTGGLVGYFTNSNAAVLQNLTATGAVSGTGDAGGLVGYATGNGSMSGALASGHVTSSGNGSYSAGGLAGYFALSGGLSSVESRGNVGGNAGQAGGLVGYYNTTAAIGSSVVVAGTPTVNANTWAGGLIGYMGQAAAISGASAESPLTVAALVSSAGHAGGLVGRSVGPISNARATGNVSSSSGSVNVGGLVGQAEGSVSFTDVSATGAVSVAGGSGNTGGLVGYANNVSIVRGNASGNIGVTGGDAGGLVGEAVGTASITDSAASGRVSAGANTGYVGGLAGYFSMSGGMARVAASGIVEGGQYTGGLVGYYTSNGALATGQSTATRVSGGTYVGGLLGYVNGAAVSDVSAIADVTASVNGGMLGGLVAHGTNGSLTRGTASGNVTGTSVVGGLAGQLEGFAVSASTASGRVVGVGSTVYAGGLVGQFGYYYYGGSSLSSSHATGDVVVDANSGYVGGLVGQAYYANISGSTASGAVTLTDSAGNNYYYNYVGGLVGAFSGSSGNSGHSISGSSSSGLVSGGNYSGGLVGTFSGASIRNSTSSSRVNGRNYAGGLVGYFSGDAISDSSATGSVSGNTRVGGLAGEVYTALGLSNVSASGAVSSADSGESVGGLVGYLSGAGIVSGFASGNVTTGSNTSYAGGLVGYAQGSAASAGGIDDSSASGAVSGGSVSGGLVGQYQGSSLTAGIVNSHASGAVNGSGMAGGLVGRYSAGSGTAQDLRNVYATGAVAGSSHVGGLVGQYSGTKGIVASYATGDVTGLGANFTTNYLGGLVGYYNFSNNGTGAVGMSQSYATGNVRLLPQAVLSNSTSVHAGGLVGFLDSGALTNVAATDVYATGNVSLETANGALRAGGLVGSARASVLHGYASGAVSVPGGSSRWQGGLVGQRTSTGVTVTDSYWNSSTSGQAGSDGGTALSPEQMQQASSFANWTIATDGSGAATGAVWRIYEGHTAPLLRTFLTPLTLTLADASKVYDGSTSFGNAVLNAASGPVAYPGRIFTDAASPDVGSYAVSAAGLWSVQNGYDLSVAGNATLTVTPRSLTLAGVVADKVYDGTRTATVIGAAQPTGLVAGEDLTVSVGNVTAVFDDKNVGTNKTVTVSGYTLSDGTNGKASNYSLAAGTQTTASITPATLRAGGFSAVDRVYDGTLVVGVSATGGSTVTGVIGNDDVHLDLTGVGTGTLADKNVGSAKPVTVTGVALSGTDAGNYVVGGVDGVTVNITPKTIAVDGLTAVNRVYNAGTAVTVQTTGAQLSGVIAGDIVQIAAGNLTGAVADKNVGTGKAVTVAGGVGLRGPDAANYIGTPGAMTVNITPATVYLDVYRVSGTDRVYDGTTNATVGIELYGLYGGDRVVLSHDAPAYSSKDVAYNVNGAVTSKTIDVANAAISGADAANYTLNTSYYGHTTTGTITPRPLAVSGVTAQNRAYDGTRNVTVDVGGATVDTSALVAADVGNVLVQVPGSGTVVGTIASKNIGNNLAVTVPGFALTGSAAGNYTLTGSNGVTVNITRKDLTATYVGVDRVYDGQTWAGVVASSTDIVPGDNVSFYANDYAPWYTAYPYAYTVPARFTGDGAKNVGTGKAVTVTYDYLTGNDANNYNYVNRTLPGSYGSTTASITPKTLSLLVFSGTNKVYDGNTSATVSLNKSGSGIVGSDVVTSTQDAAFVDKNAGTGKTINIGNFVLGGADAANYTVQAVSATATASITAKPVTFSGITAVDRAYDGTTTVAVNATGVSSAGFVQGDDVAVSQPPGGLATGTVLSKTVGNGKVVTVTGLGLSGGDAGNYSIDAAASGITVNITPRPLTAEYTGGSRAYTGGVTAPVTAGSADLIEGDVVSFTQTAVFSGLDARNAGTHKPISVTGIRISGADAGNYSLVNQTASAFGDITAKPVTVVYTATGRVYNGLADTSISVTGASTDLVAGDFVGFTQTAALRGDGAAGDGRIVDITGITLTGAQAGNYALVADSSTTTVNIARRAIGVTGISAVDRAYDGTSTVAINVGNAAVNTGSIVAADIGKVAVELPPAGISTGTMTSKDVGQNKAVTVTGLSVTGEAASNYTVTGATGITVDITPRELTAVWTAAGKVYDASATAQVSATSTDVLAGDVGALGISGSGVFAAGKNAGTGKTVTIGGGFLTGAERNNYVLLNPTGTALADIAQRAITPSYSGGTRVYDGGSAAPVTASLVGVLSGDQLSFGQTAVFSAGKDVGNGKAISITGIVIAGTDAANYRLTTDTASTTGSITPKPITVAGLGAVSATNRVYDGTTVVSVTVPTGVTLTPNSADIVAGDQVDIGVPVAGTTTGTMADKNAGTGKAVAITGLTLSGADAGNYVVAGAAGVTVDIARRDLTALYSGITRAYDGGVNVNVTGSSADVLAGDNLSISGSGRYTGDGAKNAGIGKTLDVLSAQLGGVDRNNYLLLNPTGTAIGTVTPKLLTATYAPYTRAYDRSTDAALVATGAGVVAGDEVNFSQTAVFTGANGRNVGTGKAIAVSNIALAGADAANYALTADTASTTGSITPRLITLTGLTGMQAVDRVYNGTTTVTVNLQTSGTVTPAEGAILAGDSVTVDVPGGNVTTGTMANKNAGAGKALVSIAGLGLSGPDAGNYSIAGASGLTVNITPRPLTATYSGGTRMYDGSTTAPVSASSADLIAGDTLGFNLQAGFTGAGAKNVGSDKPISITSASLTGADAANYSLVNATGSATGSITPRTLNALYSGGTRVYDGTVAAPVTASLQGLVDGDAVNASALAVFTGAGAKNVGTGKAVSVSGITLGGSDAGNYVLAADSASTTASVTPRPLRIDGLAGVTATDRSYDGTTTVAVTVNVNGTLALNSQDLVPGDAVVLDALANGATTGTLADKNVGQAKPVSVAGLSISGADAANYSLAAAAGGVTVNITPRPLTAIYSGVTRVYDGSVSASVVGSSADVVGGDSLSISGSGLFTGAGAKNVGTGKAIEVTAAALSGADATNYSLLNATGTATGSITPRSVSVLYTGGTRVYDGGTAAPVSGTGLGLVAGDDVSLGGTAQFTGAGAKNVGQNKAVSITGITLAGADAGNYVLAADSASTTASITPRPLRVDGLTAVSATDRAYDGTTLVQVSVNASGTLTPNVADVVAGDVVSVSLPGGSSSTGTVADKNVGQNKAVTVSGLVLAGADAGNYSVSAALGLSVNISPRLLTAAWVGVDKVYDGTALAQVAGTSADIVAGDVLSIIGSGSFVAGKNAGTGKAIAVSGGTLLGADAANYRLANAEGSTTASILQKLITPTYTGGTRVYDGGTQAPVTLGSVGLVAGDDVSIGQTAQFTGAGAKNVGSGKAVSVENITLAGADAANYRLAGTTAATTASITPKGVNVAGLGNLAAVDRVYDGTASVQIVATGATGNSASSTDFLAGDDVAIVVPAGGLGAGLMADKNAGSNKPVAISGLTLVGSDAANYAITGTAGVSVNIAPRPVALQGLSAVDRVYDGTLTVGIDTTGATLSGLLAGDDLRLPAAGLAGSMADKHAGNAKAVLVAGLTLVGADAANYVAGGPNLTVNIAPRPFTATLTVADKVYDGTDAATATLATTGLVAGDQVALAGGGVIRFGDKNVGAGKAVSASGLSLTGADAADYLLASNVASATASITPAPLNIGFASGTPGGSTLSKVYGETLNFAGTEFSALGLVAGETIGQVTLVSAGTAEHASVNGGPYTVNVSAARGGTFNAANYALTYTSGTLLVTPRPLTITGRLVTRYADERNPDYFDTLAMGGVTLGGAGLAAGESLLGAVLTTPPGSATAQGVSLFELLPAGAQFAPGVDASNYSLRYAAGLLVVLPKPPRVGEADNGGGGTGVGLQIDLAELERVLAALERSSSLVSGRRAPDLSLALLQAAAAEAAEGAEGAGDGTAVLTDDGRRITLPALLKLPLISFDPVLRRLIFGPAAATRRPAPEAR